MRRIGVAALILLALTACHKRAADAGDAASTRGLQVEAYDPPIPKAPVKGKLETLPPRPSPAAVDAAFSESTPDSSAAPPN